MNNFVIRLPKLTSSAGKKRSLTDSHTNEVRDVNIRKKDSPRIARNEQTPCSRKFQMFLDLGQKNFGKTSHCSKCGLLFTIDDEQDRKAHISFCNEMNEPASLSSVAAYRVLGYVRDNKDCVISMPPSQIKVSHHSIRRCVTMMEDDLGTDQCFIHAGKMLYLYVDDKKNLTGALVLDEVMDDQIVKISSFDEILSPIFSSDSKTSSENKERTCKLGVRLMWVHRNHRRKGIMRSMLDVARQHFVFGFFLDKTDIAFSQPTEEGFQFALKYCGGKNIWCYSSSPG